MSLKKNVLSNYVSQIYVTVIGIVMVPLYLKYMGAEAYGLVGFFAMLQTWFSLLDMGLTPTMSRETARFRGGATDALSYRRLVRALEGIFLTVALLGGGFMFAFSDLIARKWLQATQLPITEVIIALQLMAIIIALRWMSSLYRGAIIGFEHLVWLGVFNSLMASLRFIGVLLVLIFIGTAPKVFFSFQLVVSVLELAGVLIYTYHLLPVIQHEGRLPWSWAPLKPVLKFSLTIAFTSSVWVLVTQTDKLVLSKILPLEEYGYFTLSVLVAGGVGIISSPVCGAIMPRMVKLNADGDNAGLIYIYRKATQIVAIIAGAAATTIAFCAEPLLWAWTGDKILAQHASPILILYAIGNGIIAVAGFPYLLQYAKGNLRLHLIGNAVFVVLLIPSIIWATSQYGAVGAGYVWLVMNLFFFVIWLPIVHNKFAPGLNRNWFVHDTLLIFIVVVSAGYCLNAIMPHSGNRWHQLGEIMMFGVLLMLAGGTASSFVRVSIAGWMRKNA